MDLGRHKRLRAGLVVGVLALAGVVGALAASGSTDIDAPSSGTPGPLAGASSADCSSARDAYAGTFLGVGERIYEGEDTRYGTVDVAIASVTSSTALARAVAADNWVATRAVVTQIVYNHLHIVRLRVIRDGRMLADVGGPYVLAPLSGELRLNGRIVGRYVMSVQDDLGYRLLAERLAGMEVVMRAGDGPVLSTLDPAPESIPSQGTLRFEGVTYLTRTIDATAFPSGPLLIHLLIRAPSRPFGARTCFQIEVAALGEVGELVARQYVLSSATYKPYARVASFLTHALVYVREGQRQLASSTSRGPAHLPDGGEVRFRGRRYGVYSFADTGARGVPVRVFLLVART
jgi:hypothetical protein